MRWGSFYLGVAFSFAFCPTLFLLFFGFLVSLSASSQGGLFFPGIFAFGATPPLHILAVSAVVGSGGLGNLAQRLRRLDSWTACWGACPSLQRWLLL
jgi:hypothetical protein